MAKSESGLDILLDYFSYLVIFSIHKEVGPAQVYRFGIISDSPLKGTVPAPNSIDFLAVIRFISLQAAGEPNQSPIGRSQF